jgi:hypothetical protein
MSLDYAEFLASKRRVVGAVGHDVAVADVHPLLHEWQARTVAWAVHKGRCAIWWDCGLGKTFAQLEWARLSGDRALIMAPLSVARQTVREARKIDLDVRYVRHQDEAAGPGLFITNYEMADHFDPSSYDAVVFDESSIVKHHTSQTRQRLCIDWAVVPRRLACTATPAPNDIAELTNHAELLGIMPRVEMLAAYFVHDDEGWRLKGHAVEPMWRWISSWATTARGPADLGYPDDGYDLPPLRIHEERVDHVIDSPDQLFATDIGGVGGRASVRRQTMDARVERAAKLASGTDDQWIVWCGLNDESRAITSSVPGAVELTGSDTPEHKAATIEAFQDGAIRVLVTKASIAGFGVNLQNCHRMAFVGMGDSYEAYYQAIRRCYRFGQTEPVEAHIVVSAIESQIVANVRRKEQQDRDRIGHLVRYSREELANVD